MGAYLSSSWKWNVGLYSFRVVWSFRSVVVMLVIDIRFCLFLTEIRFLDSQFQNRRWERVIIVCSSSWALRLHTRWAKSRQWRTCGLWVRDSYLDTEYTRRVLLPMYVCMSKSTISGVVRVGIYISEIGRMREIWSEVKRMPNVFMEAFVISVMTVSCESLPWHYRILWKSINMCIHAAYLCSSYIEVVEAVELARTSSPLRVTMQSMSGKGRYRATSLSVFLQCK
jgi:hypothetical protein